MSDADRLRVVVLDDYQGVAAALGEWSSIAGEVEVDSIREHIADPARLCARIGSARVVVAMRERTLLSDQVLADLSALELIVTTGPSNVMIDVAAANARGIDVCGTGGYLTPTSELTWALILALMRNVPAEDRSLREGGWQHTLGRELAGRTLGIIGLGRVGTLVAKVGLAFDMNVIAWSPNLNSDQAAAVGVRAVEREELFTEADVVTVHMVLSERSRGLVGGSDLARMKPTAILVNTSRGPIIDEKALVDVLERRAIGGAALDVFDREPLPKDHPLRGLENTVLTPHLGYVSDGLYDLFFREIVEDIAAWRRGELIRVVEP
ncbi:MAG: phosphoglycerate dehydrogenase-like enzyme [Candidatus Aldehydirespiratoraceae bacterium]|jgi:phosphoglycerate dehydrogenase-like enzyme